MRKRSLSAMLGALFMAVLAIVLFTPSIAEAAETVTYSDYYSAVANEAAKHGLSTEILEPVSPDTEVPIEDLNAQLDLLKSLPAEIKPELTGVEVIPEEITDPLSSSLFGSTVKVNRTYRTSWTVWPRAAMRADIFLEVSAKVQMPDNIFVGTNSCRTYQSGTSWSFESWVQSSSSSWYTSSRVYGSATGTITFKDGWGIGYNDVLTFNYNWGVSEYV